jgi:photosystem I subunit 3
MRRLFSILLATFLVLGLAPIANAAGENLNPDRDSTNFSASALQTCSENARFKERASQASSPKDIARFERYGKASCGDDGLPHLILAPTIEPFGASLNRHHEGDLLIPAHIFIYIAGIIGWSGREYLRAIRGKKDAADKEIFIDFALARQSLIKGAAWPIEANKQGRSGDLRESDDKITLNGPR